MVSLVCGAYTNNTATTTLQTIILIIIKQSQTHFTSNTSSIHFSGNKTPTLSWMIDHTQTNKFTKKLAQYMVPGTCHSHLSLVP